MITDTTPSGWIGETFFYGGSPTEVSLSNNDGAFDDGHIEKDGAQTLSEPVAIDGVAYPAGSVVENEFSLTDASGADANVIRIDGSNVGFSYKAGDEPDVGVYIHGPERSRRGSVGQSGRDVE
ncbi:MAG: hypothetical protein AAF922_18325 [Pseudomonadota bacterium]